MGIEAKKIAMSDCKCGSWCKSVFIRKNKSKNKKQKKKQTNVGHHILNEPLNSTAFFKGNVESKCHLWTRKGQMQSEHELSGYVAKSDQGEAGLGIQLVLKVASGSSAASPSFGTTIVLSVLVFLGPCFPKQISSFPCIKWHIRGSLPSKFSSSLQGLSLNPKQLSNQKGRWFLEFVVSPGWCGKCWEESEGPWVKVVLLLFKYIMEITR